MVYLRCSCPYELKDIKTLYFRESWSPGWGQTRKTRYVTVGVICLGCNYIMLEEGRNAQSPLPES